MTSVLLVILLALMTVRVAQRAARIYTRESAARREEQLAVGKDPVMQSEGVTPQPGFDPVTSGPPAAQPQINGGVSMPSVSMAGVSPRQKSEKGDRLAGSHAAKPVTPDGGARSDTAVAVAASRGADGGRVITDAGVEQLLAEERAAHVGPSDQPSAVFNSGSNIESSLDSRAAASGTRSSQQQGLQSPPLPQQQQQKAVLQSKYRAAGSAGASPFATTVERPGSPLGRAETAPPTATGRLSYFDTQDASMCLMMVGMIATSCMQWMFVAPAVLRGLAVGRPGWCHSGFIGCFTLRYPAGNSV
jgi:hypothetical protein